MALPAAALISRIKAKGPLGLARELHPTRLRGRLEIETLRRVTLDQLVRTWCGQVEKVSELRARALGDVLQFARRSVPYYRALFDAAGVARPTADDLGKLPVLDKALIRRHDRELRCTNWTLRPHYRQLTSGTTGQGLDFVVDTRAAAVLGAHQEFAFRLMGFRARMGHRIAAFAGPMVPESERARGVYWIPRPGGSELPFGSVVFASHYMNERTLPAYFDEVERVGFRFFLGYPSAVHALARYCLDSGRRFSRPIEGIQLTSEVVLDGQVSDIEAAFGGRVYLQYGHSEASVYAHTTDETREYLCSPLVGWVEVLDGSGRHVRPGEEGDIVVTGFHSRAMPLIRYRTEDVGVYGGEREGITVLRKVLGRVQESIVLRDGTRVPLTGLVFGQHMAALARADRWQMVQEKPGEVTVLVMPGSGYRDDDEREIVATLWRVAGVSATVRRVTDLPRSPGGKHLFVVDRMQAP